MAEIPSLNSIVASDIRDFGDALPVFVFRIDKNVNLCTKKKDKDAGGCGSLDETLQDRGAV